MEVGDVIMQVDGVQVVLPCRPPCCWECALMLQASIEALRIRQPPSAGHCCNWGEVLVAGLT